jgi:hypothetical protein
MNIGVLVGRIMFSYAWFVSILLISGYGLALGVSWTLLMAPLLAGVLMGLWVHFSVMSLIDHLKDLPNG